MQQALARNLEEDNARLSKRAAELEDSGTAAAAAAAAPANGTTSSVGEEGQGQGQEDGWEVVGEGEHDRARLEEVWYGMFRQHSIVMVVINRGCSELL